MCGFNLRQVLRLMIEVFWGQEKTDLDLERE